MRILPEVLRALFVATVALASGSAAVAAQRTFLASNGTDVNPCSLTQPCRGFSRAITQTATDGEIVVLDSAGYGPVTITKGVSIIAPAGIYGGITVSSGDGVTINAPGATVVLRGLSINGQGGAHGILLQQAGRVRVENCVVSHMGAVAIYHTAPNGEMIIVDTMARDNVDGIALVASNASIELNHVRVEHNQNSGFYIAPTPGGGTVDATIIDSAFSNNGANGICVDAISGAVTRAQIERSLMSGNAADGFKVTSGAGTAEVTLGRNAYSRNGIFAIETDAPTGSVLTSIAENIVENSIVGNGIYLSGAGTDAYLNGNTSLQFACVLGAKVASYGNNAVKYTTGCGTLIGTK
jgi:hypothetical protein